MGHLDHGAKRISEEDRRAFLSVVGCLGLNEEAEVLEVQREIVASQKIADHLYRVRAPGGDWRLEHVESLARWKKREINAIVERAMTVSLVPSVRTLPIRTWILLMTPRGVPSRLPTKFHRVRGDLESILRVRYRSLWETPASELFGMGRPSILPLVPLSAHGERDMREASELLLDEGDEDLISQFLAHGRIGYSVDELRRLTKVLEKQTLELLAETKDGKRLVRQGRKAGRQEGLLVAVRRLLEDRFPSLVGSVDLDSFDYDRAERAFSALLAAKSVREARKALGGG